MLQNPFATRLHGSRWFFLAPLLGLFALYCAPAFDADFAAPADPDFMHWRIDAGFIHDHYGSPRDNEPSAYTQIGYAFSRESGVYLHYDWLKEYGLIDESIVAGGYWRVAPKWLVTAEASATPGADFRPRVLVLLGAEWLATDYVQPLLGYRYMDYDLTTRGTASGVTLIGKGPVRTITSGVRLIARGFGNLEVRYNYTHNLDASYTGVTQLRLNFDDVGRWIPYLAFAHGKEALPPLAPAVITVYSGGSIVALSDSLSLRLDLAYEHREGYYNHETAALGVTWRF